MKAAVITLHNVCNYGTQLQAYATQEKLKEYFDEVEFINFRRKDTYGIDLLRTFTKGNIIKAIPILPTLLRWKFVFKGFQDKYLNISPIEYSENFNGFEDQYDVYISGSDQVWNCGWNKGVIPPFYLSFVPDEKPRFAFSSSFGQQIIDQKCVDESLEYIQKYKFITVREESGVQILLNQYNYKGAVRVLDPTLLMTSDFWREHAPKRKIKEDYILIYNLMRNNDLDVFAEKIASKTGYKLYRFCTRYDQMVRNGKSILVPNVWEFISLIDNASLVITDSFHATAFSMNLNTEPICIYPKEYGGRISEFLELLDEEKRHMKDIDDVNILDRHVNFKRVNTVLQKERVAAKMIFDQMFTGLR